jgi:hypothetical protein
VRVWNEPVMHRYGHGMVDPRVALTICGVRFCWMGWPNGAARPQLPRCPECFA